MVDRYDSSPYLVQFLLYWTNGFHGIITSEVCYCLYHRYESHKGSADILFTLHAWGIYVYMVWSSQCCICPNVLELPSIFNESCSQRNQKETSLTSIHPFAVGIFILPIAVGIFSLPIKFNGAIQFQRTRGRQIQVVTFWSGIRLILHIWPLEYQSCGPDQILWDQVGHDPKYRRNHSTSHPPLAIKQAYLSHNNSGCCCCCLIVVMRNNKHFELVLLNANLWQSMNICIGVAKHSLVSSKATEVEREKRRETSIKLCLTLARFYYIKNGICLSLKSAVVQLRHAQAPLKLAQWRTSCQSGSPPRSKCGILKFSNGPSCCLLILNCISFPFLTTKLPFHLKNHTTRPFKLSMD
ncbi:hypothetical protein VP01_339g2 [Puccinia sorghi]|uniref:Uncharacterized protein n=1 Tax=Puccinia sorghi TaxID=27349 RepID=A0A0L6UYJ0_9BASI|nr:hypothetical protein VP01_339g2 [Puccinia sorghi]